MRINGNKSYNEARTLLDDNINEGTFAVRQFTFVAQIL